LISNKRGAYLSEGRHSQIDVFLYAEAEVSGLPRSRSDPVRISAT